MTPESLYHLSVVVTDGMTQEINKRGNVDGTKHFSSGLSKQIRFVITVTTSTVL